ncbi:hypothetical protein [Lentzea sp. NPDC060358]|uniref:hypothetical protein n=1 Tax=Lentzea sp. NPDC060358 TaxID=3347103 RepID=UPI00365D55A0
MRGTNLALESDAHRATGESTWDSVAAAHRAVDWPAEREGAAFTAPSGATRQAFD